MIPQACKVCGTADRERFCANADGLPHPTTRYDRDTGQVTQDGPPYAMPEHVGLCCDCLDETIHGAPPREDRR